MRIWSRAKKRDELIQLPPAANGPFGEDPGPWYKRSRKPAAPRGYSFALGTASALLSGWAASGLHGLEKYFVAFLILVAPTWALETWCKQHRRRQEDTLFAPLDESR